MFELIFYNPAVSQILTEQRCFPISRFKPLKYRLPQCALAWCVFFLIFFLMRMSPTRNNVLIWFVPTLCMLLFCKFSVLYSLRQPGPGERDERRKGDKMKRKAFNLIFVHLVCFLVNYVPVMVAHRLTRQIHISSIVLDLAVGLGMMCGHVQPLLYLHRAGKLSCIRKH